MKFANTDASGKNSRGKLNCLLKDACLKSEEDASDKELEKKNQGIIADKAKRGKLSIVILMTLVNTNVITPMMRSGVITAHHIPNVEPTYFDFNSLKVIFHKIALQETMCLTLLINSIMTNHLSKTLRLQHHIFH